MGGATPLNSCQALRAPALCFGLSAAIARQKNFAGKPSERSDPAGRLAAVNHSDLPEKLLDYPVFPAHDFFCGDRGAKCPTANIDRVRFQVFQFPTP
jgi:hypothetical protein